MKVFIRDLHQRIEEINEYFSFVIFIDGIETHKRQKLQINGDTEYIPKRELQKILRSNCFLLLYNLVESGIRNSILAVYDSIHDDSLKFDDLSEKLKEIWISNQTRKAQLSEKNLKIWLRGQMNNLSEHDEIRLDRDSINISGNLDYANIQKIIIAYGFFGRITTYEKDVKSALDRVKRERNSLAHGNKTFCQSGEIITVNELINIKDHISSFLNETLVNIEGYIDRKLYRK